MRRFSRFFLALTFLALFVSACELSLPETLPNSVPTDAPINDAATSTPVVEMPVLPPDVVEVYPPVGSWIGLQEELTFYFNQPMERGSVEAALRVDPVIEGQFSWVDDATLKFTPHQMMEAGSKLNITLETGASSVQGMALETAQSFSFQTAALLHPIQFLPEAGSEGISIDSAVAVTFDQPVVALGADSASLPAAFSLEPPVAGSGEWLNTSTYIFYPEPALAGGETYHAILNADLRSTAGTPLENAGNWGFSTGLPRLLEINPSTEVPLPLDLAWTFTFNQPMNTASFEENFALLAPDGSKVSGSFEWSENERAVTFVVDELLARDTAYQLFLGGATRARGGTALGLDRTIEVYSSPTFAVISTDPVRGGLTNEYQAAHVFFSTDVAPDDIEDYVSISPETDDFRVYVYDNGIHLNGYLAHETSYVLTIAPELKDIWGQELGEAFVFRFTTPKASPTLNFPYLGAPFFFTSADDPAFYIQSTNIPLIDLTFGEVPMTDFFRLFGANGYSERQYYLPVNAFKWQQRLEITPNQSETFAIDLATEADAIKPGIYALRVWEAYAQNGEIPQYIVASNVNLLFKHSTTDALIWATELKTGARLISQPVYIYDEEGSLLAEGLTDEQGIWHGKIDLGEDTYQAIYAVLGQPGDESFGFAAPVWSDGLTPWEFGFSSDYQPPHTQIYLYTDRPIYRPGQTVYFRALIRDAYDGRYSPTSLPSLPLTLSDGHGNNIATFNPSLSEYGSIHGYYTLPEDSVPGYYTFYNNDLNFSAYFQVADYRKPEVNLTLEAHAKNLLAGETLNAELSARYFFDAPAADLPLQWAIYESDHYFSLPGYHVGKTNFRWMVDENYYGGFYGKELERGEGKTDGEGKFTLEFEEESMPNARNLTIEITATDESNQWISQSAEVIVHPEEFYIGLKADTWVGREDTEIGFDILTVDWEKNPLPTENLRALFQRVVWREDGAADGSPGWVSTTTNPAKVDFLTGADGAARLAFTPPDPGTYLLTVSSGNASSEILLWVRGADKAVFPSTSQQHIELIADKDAYKPNETAQIFIPNPLSGVTQALITTERGAIHSSELINIPSEGMLYNLPLTDDDAPVIYFSVVLLDGSDFRVGYAQIEVAPTAQLLNINIISEPTRSEPGGEVTFGIQVTDSTGKPVQGEFSLAVVDLAALSLANPNSVPIDEAFYSQTGLGIKTSLSMSGDSVYGVFLNFGGMGGGGGGDDLIVVRDDFPDTAYWNAEVLTDENGLAQVRVILPDNLTTWQVDLRGITAESLVGSAEMQLVSTKDLLIRPVTPRFMVMGDHVEMAAIVHNNTNQALSGRVLLQAIGFLLDDPESIEQFVTVPAGGRVTVSWWGTAQDAEGAELLFNSEFGDYTDVTRPTWGTLPIYRYTSPQSFVTAGTLESAGGVTEAISLPRSFVPMAGKLEVTFDASLAAIVLKNLDAIPEPAPNASNESLLSYLLPNLSSYKALQAAGLNDPELDARLEAALDTGVRRLLDAQNDDFGWGWYADMQTDSYISAYILFGLWQARDVVYIDETVFANARATLQNASQIYLAEVSPQVWQKDRVAFMQYVLQLTGGADNHAIEKLYEWREGLSPWAQALLALSLDSRTADDARAASLLANLEASALRSASSAHWEADASSWRNPGTPNYTTAVVIYALAQKDAANPLLNDAVRYLSAHRNMHGFWSSTYENAWSMLAFTEVIKGANELDASFPYTAYLNGNLIAEAQANPLSSFFTNKELDSLQLSMPNALYMERGEGAGRLYYRAALFVSRAAENAPALNRGMEIARFYYDFDCKEDCTPLDGAKLGEGQKLKVQLVLNLPEDSYYVQVEDYLPAGAEVLNQNLNTSQRGEYADEVTLYESDNPFAAGWGWWYFSEPQIGDENIQWSADYLPAGTYVLSYTIIPMQAGEYRVLPAHAWQSYFPEVQGASAGEIFVITD